MSLRLKSRTQAPPGGYLYRQKETGWESWKIDPVSQWDFRRLCQVLRQHRMSNPQFNLNTNMAMIEHEVDAANAARVAAMPGAETYIVNDEAPTPFTEAPTIKARLQTVAGQIKKLSSGADVLLAWERSGDAPVPKDHAEARALVCSQCPKNGKGDLSRWFTVPFSELIRKQIERLAHLKLQTSLDDRLGVCEACLCPLALKVWTPTKHVLEHLTSKVEQALQPENPRCWVLQEKDKA